MLQFLNWFEQEHVRSFASWVVLTVCLTISAAFGLSAKWQSTELQYQTARASLFRQIVDNLDSAVIVADDKAVIREWNDKASKLLGWTREEAIGTNLQVLMPAEARAAFTEGYDTVLKDPGLSTTQIRCWIVTKTGSRRLVLLQVRAVRASEQTFGFALIDREADVEPVTLPCKSREPVSPPVASEFRSES